MLRNENHPFFLGIDAVEFKKALRFYRTHRSRLTKFFTPNEVSYILGPGRKHENFATLMAAKEAVFKAHGGAWMGPSGFQLLEVVDDKKKLSFRDWTLSVMRKKDMVIVRCAGTGR
jgi:phosphopantetheine--protein transferase-like protein